MRSYGFFNGTAVKSIDSRDSPTVSLEQIMETRRLKYD